MRKFTNLLVAVLALLGTVISVSADIIVSPVEIITYAIMDNIWVIVLVIVVVIVAIALLRIFRKK